MLPGLEDFCELISKIKRSNAEKAMALLWYFDNEVPGATRSAGELTKLLTDHHIGTPNQTLLASSIRKTKLANEVSKGFVLKPGSRKIIRDWFPDLTGLQPRMDHASGYLPEAIWNSTRGYIEEVCRELNGAFNHGYFNSAAVMLRRLLETLIIEAYEHLHRESEIRNGGGDFFMLSDLVERACGEGNHRGLSLGRDSKKALKEARNVGNWSAHARRFLAHSGDLTKFQDGMRLLVQDLVQIANLQKK